MSSCFFQFQIKTVRTKKSEAKTKKEDILKESYFVDRLLSYVGMWLDRWFIAIWWVRCVMKFCIDNKLCRVWLNCRVLTCNDIVLPTGSKTYTLVHFRQMMGRRGIWILPASCHTLKSMWYFYWEYAPSNKRIPTNACIITETKRLREKNYASFSIFSTHIICGLFYLIPFQIITFAFFSSFLEGWIVFSVNQSQSRFFYLSIRKPNTIIKML